jgi:hypothetical protein
MNNYFCSGYVGSGTTWPQQPFPGNLFPGWDTKRRVAAQKAWQLFETVEAADAATRVRLSAQGGWTPPAPSVFAQVPSIWYPILTEGDRTLYTQGRLLHEQACPGTNWRAQRSLGIPTTPITNVYPEPKE